MPPLARRHKYKLMQTITFWEKFTILHKSNKVFESNLVCFLKEVMRQMNNILINSNMLQRRRIWEMYFLEDLKSE